MNLPLNIFPTALFTDMEVENDSYRQEGLQVPNHMFKTNLFVLFVCASFYCERGTTKQ